MAGSVNFPGMTPLTAAQAVSYAKGQEVQNSTSTESKEKERQLRNLLFKAKAQESQQKPNDAQKGFLA